MKALLAMCICSNVNVKKHLLRVCKLEAHISSTFEGHNGPHGLLHLDGRGNSDRCMCMLACRAAC